MGFVGEVADRGVNELIGFAGIVALEGLGEGFLRD